MPPQRLPIVNSDDGTWGDILRQYLLKEHYDDGTNNAANGGHKTITIRAGTASANTAPLKFTSGTLLTTPEAGAIEFNTDTLYFTQTTGATRTQIITNTGTQTLTNKTLSGSSNTFTNIPQSAVTNLTTDLAGKVGLGNNTYPMLAKVALDFDSYGNDSTLLSPMINDLAFNNLRGGSTSVTLNGSPGGLTSIDNAFRPDASVASNSSLANSDVLVVTVTCHKSIRYEQDIGILMAQSWRARDVKIEVFYSGSWVEIYNVTGSTSKLHSVHYDSNASNDITQIRYTLTNFSTTLIRIISLFSTDYDSDLLSAAYLTLEGGTIYGQISNSADPTSVNHLARKGYVDTGLAGKANTSHTHTAANISDSTSVGRSVLTAVDAAAARTAIGAGTGNGDVTLTGTQTLTNKTIVLPGLDSLYTGTPTNVNYSVSTNSGQFPAFSPVPKYVWHDLLRFNRWFGAPTYETYSGSWSTQTLDTSLFNGKEAQSSYLADGTTTTAVRWTWNSGNVSWSNISWWVIGFTYDAGGQSNSVVVESSADGSAWTTRHTSTTSASSNPVWFYQDSHSGDPYIRLTVTTTSAKVIRISSIRALSTRWGNQGGGSEYEFPYDWDSNRNLTLGATVGARSDGVLNLGATTTTTAAGGIYFGNDTNLYRSAADTLRTDDSLIIGTAGTVAGSAVTIDGTQTLTNKTLTTPFVNNYIDFNDVTGSKLQLYGSNSYAIGVESSEFRFSMSAGANYKFYAGGYTAGTEVASITNAGMLTTLGEIRAGAAGTQTNSVVTNAGTQTLTNKTISGSSNTLSNIALTSLTSDTSTALGVGSINLGHASDTTITRTGAGAIAVEGVGVALNSTSLAHTAGTLELGHATDTTLARGAAGRLTVENVNVPTISSTDTLTNKTLSGSNNTFSNIPVSAITGLGTDYSRLVVTTAAGSTGTENGPNTWALIATFSTGTSQFSEGQLILNVNSTNSAYHDTAIISVYFRTNATGANPAVDVRILAKGGTGLGILSDSFKVISDGWSSDMQLWFKKGANYSRYNFYEVSQNYYGGTLTYATNPAWQSATPTGTVNNVISNGVHSGLPFTANGTITGTQLISNVSTGTAPLTVASTTLVANLNADLLDGMNATSANTPSTIVSRDSNGDFTGRYLMSTYVNMSHSAATRNTDTVFYSSTDAYIRKNTAAGFKTSLALENVDNTSDATKNSAAAVLTNKDLTSGTNTFPTFNQNTTGNAATATTATNQSGGTVSATTGDFSTYVRANELRNLGGQQLVLNAGESHTQATGQTAEYIYLNAEDGIQINSSPDNWSSNWAGRVTTTINSTGIVWNGNTVWHAGNDGAGSGLDADTLDGQQASAFAASSHTHTAANISDSTATGRSVLTAANAAAARSAIGAGTGDGDVTLNGSQTLTNKTINGSSNTITNLSATSITSGAFQMAQIGIGDFENIVAGSDFETAYYPWNLGTGRTIASDQAHSGTYSYKFTAGAGSASFTGGNIELKEGDQLYVECWVRRDASYNATDARIRLGAMPGNVNVANLQFPASSFTEIDTWVKKSFTTNPYPAGNIAVAPSITMTGLSAGNLWIDDIVIRRVKTTDVIPDLDASKITAGTLPVARGGTGAASLSGIVVGNGTSAFTTITAPSGSIVGTSDTQTLTGKTISGSSNTLSNIALSSLSTSDLSTLSSSLRANRNISGGGTITVDGSGYVSWSARLIVIANGRGTNFSTGGYFDINCPTSGTITGVGGSANKTATAAGVPLAAWEALYYILPIGSGSGTNTANFRVATYTSNVDIPHDWVLICVRNGDNGTFTFNNGISLGVNQSMNSIHQSHANTANTLVRRDASGDFAAGVMTGTRFVSNVATGTAPLTVSSTTTVTNLNADLLDGQHASAFAAASHTHTAANISDSTAVGRSVLTAADAAAARTAIGAGTGNGDVTLTGVQTLTNKTFNDDSFTLQDGADNTKKIVFSLGGMDTASTITLNAPNVTSGSHTIVTRNSTDVLLNKRITPRVTTVTSSATPVFDTDDTDVLEITALATNITSMTSSMTGAPENGQKLLIRIKDNGSARSIVWGASWRSMGVTLPVVTTASKIIYVGAIYNSNDSIWDVIAVEQQA